MNTTVKQLYALGMSLFIFCGYLPGQNCTANSAIQFVNCVNSSNPTVIANTNFSADLTGLNISGKTIDVRNFIVTIVGNPTINAGSDFDVNGNSGTLIVSNGTTSVTFKQNAEMGPPPVYGLAALNTAMATGSYSNLYAAVLAVTGINLPITLSYFQARSEEGGILISWKTAAELNNDHMVIEKSRDGVRFQEIGQVKGRGTATTPFTYSFVDPNPQTGPNYYRLKQVDTDGKFIYSKTIVADTNGFIHLYAYPNPVSERIFVRSTEEVINTGLHLFDALGRRTLLQWNGSNVLYEAALPAFLSPGLYTLADTRGEHKTRLSIVR
jgi:hypothetical protein